jgi:glycerate kinase
LSKRSWEAIFRDSENALTMKGGVPAAGRHWLVAIDKFKGTITALEAARALGAGLEASGAAQVTLAPLADGGDGFVEALTPALQLRRYEVEVTGSFPGSRVAAHYGGNAASSVAVVEMALACGLASVPASQRDPLETTSFGLGELIAAAARGGFRHIVVGLGGSSTNDAGLGALQALGVCVGTEPTVSGPLCGKHLSLVRAVELGVTPLLKGVRLQLATDVTSPFVGPEGAVAVFSAQKGASAAAQSTLEAGMRHVLPLLPGAERTPGAGAAGGAAGGLLAVLGAELVSGAELLSQHVGLERLVDAADAVITGEGCFDSQSASGKIVSHVLELCRTRGRPCVVVCGKVTASAPPPATLVSLVERFGETAALTDTAACLRRVGATLTATL